MWLLLLFVKGTATSCGLIRGSYTPETRCMFHLHSYLSVPWSHQQTAPTLSFWQRGTKTASFTLEQPQTPWVLWCFLSFCEMKGASPLVVGHRLWSITFLLYAISWDTVSAWNEVILQDVCLFLVLHCSQGTALC